MNRRALVVLSILLAMVVGCGPKGQAQEAKPAAAPTSLALPKPDLSSNVTVEQAIRERRSIRKYSTKPLTLQQVSCLLWAAQGITDQATGHRAAPSAMATYPLTVYLVAGNVEGLPPGVYRYVPQGHRLELVLAGDQRANIGSQPQQRTAPALFLFADDITKTSARVGKDMASEWAHIEAGHSAENILLEEIALGLVGVPMTGFDPAKVKALLKLPEAQNPFFLVAAGNRG